MRSKDYNILLLIPILGLLSFLSIVASLLLVSAISSVFNWMNIFYKFFRLFTLADKEIEANMYIVLVLIVFPISFVIYRICLYLLMKKWNELGDRVKSINLKRIVAILTLIIGYIGFFQLFFIIISMEEEVFESISVLLFFSFMLLILPYTDFVLKESNYNESQTERLVTKNDSEVGRGTLKEKSYVREVIIGALFLIILSLTLKLLSLEVNMLPSWFFGNLFLGIFTLTGAYFGASIAGKSTLNATEKQLSYQRAEWLRIEKEKTLKIEASLTRHIKTVANSHEKISLLVKENYESFLKNRTYKFKFELEQENDFLFNKMESLDKLPPDYLPPHIFRDIQKIMFFIENLHQEIALFLSNAGVKRNQSKKIYSILTELEQEIAKAKSKLNI